MDYAGACCKKQRRSLPSASPASIRCRCMWPPARYLNGLAKWRAGDRMGGLAEMRRGWTLLHENDCYLCEPFWGMQVAVANAEAGQLETGLEILRELIAWTEQSGQHWLDAELHRARVSFCCVVTRRTFPSPKMPSTGPWKSPKANRRRLSSCAAQLDLRTSTIKMAEWRPYPRCSRQFSSISTRGKISPKSKKRRSLLRQAPTPQLVIVAVEPVRRAQDGQSAAKPIATPRIDGFRCALPILQEDHSV